MADAEFLAMRADLVARGLLTADFRLTEAGVAHVDGLIVDLREAEAPEEPSKPRVRWTYNRRVFRDAHARKAA